MFVYCKKCRYIIKKKSDNSVCPACEVSMFDVPSEYLSATGSMFISQEKRKEFESSLIDSTEYDSNAEQNRSTIIAEKEAQNKERVEKMVKDYHEKNSVPCPICNSKSTTKISQVGKVLSVGVFGLLGADDIGKTYRCNSCGCKF